MTDVAQPGFRWDERVENEARGLSHDALLAEPLAFVTGGPYLTRPERTHASYRELKRWLMFVDTDILSTPAAAHWPFGPPTASEDVQVVLHGGVRFDRLERIIEALEVPHAPLSGSPSPEAMQPELLARLTWPLHSVLLRASQGAVRAALRLQESVRPRSIWADAIGPVLSTEAFAATVGRSISSLEKGIDLDTALVIETSDNELLFPAAQIGRDGRVLPGLVPLLRELPEQLVDRYTLAAWLNKSRPELGDSSVWDRLRQTNSYPDDVAQLVRRFRARAKQ